MPDRPPAPTEDEKPPRPPAPREQSEPTADLLELAGTPGPVPAELRDVSFPLALRGYDREAVEAYVKQVNEVIAELEASRSPQSAVKLALDRVGEQTAGVLQRAREAAEELTSTTLAEADHTSRRTRVEAAELMERADKESRAMVQRATEESEELLSSAHREAAERLSDAEERIAAARASAEAQLEGLERQVEQAREERRHVIEELRATAADLEAFAERAEGDAMPRGERAEASAPTASADTAGGQGAESEQPTVIAPAVEAEADTKAGAEDAKGSAEPPTARRRPRHPHQPRPPRASPQRSGAGNT